MKEQNSVSYIWVETVAYVVDAILVLSLTVEKNLPEEQEAIQARKSGTLSESGTQQSQE